MSENIIDIGNEVEVRTQPDDLGAIEIPNKKSRKGIGGKPRSVIWSQFEEITETNNTSGQSIIKQKCLNCGDLVSSRADRLDNHLKNCRSKQKKVESPSTSNQLRNLPASFQQNLKESNVTTNSNNTTTTSKTPKISSHFKSTSSKEKAKLDTLVAKFWFSANLSFKSAQLQTWKDLVSELRPSYQPPSDEVLRNRLLDEVYDEKYSDMKQKLSQKSMVLIQDGWSNIHNEPILSHSILCEGQAYLFDSIECGPESKTAQFCLEKLENAIEKAENEFDSKVIAVVTDNTNTVVSMRNSLARNYPEVLTYGCSPHMMNGLCDEISPKNIMAKIVEAQKYFRNHHKANGLLKEKQGLNPILPVPTRWSSYLSCIETFTENRTKYIEISQIQGVLSIEVSATVNSFAIFKKTQDLMPQLQALQGHDSNIADAMHSWLELAQNPILSPHKKAILTKMEVCVRDFFYAAYMLHPKYQGKYLNSDQKNLAKSYLEKKNENFLIVAKCFEAKDVRFFSSSDLLQSVMESTPPDTWWLSLKGQKGIPDEFIELVCKFYKCPASSASVEQIFSTFGFIQNDTRNKLTQDRLSKLTFCFRSLRK